MTACIRTSAAPARPMETAGAPRRVTARCSLPSRSSKASVRTTSLQPSTLSPRDASGHGSHVAATAAGNQGVAVTIGRQSFGRVSGVAPAAALAVYKACWAAPDPANDGCTSVDTIRAIDQAVSDGVDVLNLSLSDADPTAVDPVEIALLNATHAGLFIAASAGDNGPARATVAHPGPWVTTVAASTGADYPGLVRLGDGTELTGAMVSADSVNSRRLVYAGDAPDGRSRSRRRSTLPRRIARCRKGRGGDRGLRPGRELHDSPRARPSTRSAPRR